jgi:hypothetical protein
MDIDSKDKKIKVQCRTSLPLFVLAMLIPYLAWNGFLQLDNNLGVWFQRSGSLMVLFAIWVEFKLFKIGNYIYPGKNLGDMEDAEKLNEKYSFLIQILKYTAAIPAILGIVIWGYGDLFWSLLQ